MCGVFGYLGREECAAKEILAGLQRLEYRGYDSAGIALLSHEKQFEIVKSVGKVGALKIKIESYDLAPYHVGIGHTRWATHGGVTEANCHPHISQNGRFAVIHNGIIENYSELRSDLENRGYSFYSETDTEVVAKLFEDIFDGDHLSTLQKLTTRIHGAYGLVFLDREFPDRIFGTKKGSPLVLGFGDGERFVSSDYRALIGLIHEYIILEDADIFVMTPEEYTILSEDTRADRIPSIMDESEKAAELGEFEHFMLKEIADQGDAIRDVFRGRVDFARAELHSETLLAIAPMEFERIVIVASGTSYHAGLMGKYYLEEYADIPTDVIVSAEFKYKKKFIDPKTLFVFVSQSGETADTLDSLKIVRDQGGNVFGVVNVPGSSIARFSAQGLYTRAGIEVGVASTKAFTTQVVTFLIMALHLGKRKNLDYKRYREILSALERLPDAIEALFAEREQIQKIANSYAHYRDFFFLAREGELPIAMEGSLKLKEISYIHSEAYASGELKHGSIALIDADFPSIILNSRTPLYEKNISTVEEIKARSGKVIGVIARSDPKKSLYDAVMEFDSIDADIDPILEAVILQLFAYYIALHLDRDIDKPRNLAKSVTVE